MPTVLLAGPPFGEAFDDYLRDWAEAIRRHIVESVPLRR